LVNNYAEKFFQLANYSTIEKTVLEVGCSTGLLLKQFSRNGWVTSGIEPSKSATDCACRLGLNVSNTDLGHFDTKNKFSLIVMIHVLEHVDDPRQTIKRLSKFIRPKGRLFLSVPNFGGLTPTLFGSRWPYLLPNEHRWHFTPKSLSLLLNDCDFTVIKSETNAGLFGLAHPGGQLLWSLTHLKKIFFRLLFFLPYDLVSTKLNIASNLIITSQKAR
jgi:SAM-dependent methyltransferase